MGTSLPHWYQPGVSYFVTFRTEDSMSVEVSRRWHAQRADWLQRHKISMGNRNWQEQLDRLDAALRREFHETFSRQYLEALDRGLGACVLRRPELSKIVADALLHFDRDRYHMGDFVVMPNHVHAIVCLLGDTEIEAQCTSWKRFAAKKINQLLKARGRFWQEESFDHLIRSPEQFEAIRRYIAENPQNLRPGEFHLYQRPVAGTFHVPSASSSADVEASPSATGDGPVAGSLRVPSAASSSKSEAASTSGHGTWNVPATVAGTFHVPSAPPTTDIADPPPPPAASGDGTWNVPATLEDRP
jgi:type I restriction enzyme R subunit